MLDARLQDLADQLAIREVHCRYCRGVDRGDWDLVLSCFHPGARDDHGTYTGTIEGFVAFAREQASSPFQSTTHMVGNMLVEVDGDTARSEAYTWCFHRLVPAEDGTVLDLLLNVRYLDEWERRHREWRITDRLVVVDSERADPVTVVPDPRNWVSPKSAWQWNGGSRGHDDPSYRRGVGASGRAVRSRA